MGDMSAAHGLHYWHRNPAQHYQSLVAVRLPVLTANKTICAKCSRKRWKRSVHFLPRVYIGL